MREPQVPVHIKENKSPVNNNDNNLFIVQYPRTVQWTLQEEIYNIRYK